MAELVDGKILGPAQAGQIIVGQAPAPHQFRACLIIVRPDQGGLPEPDGRAQNGLRQRVGQLIALYVGKIAVQRMHQ